MAEDETYPKYFSNRILTQEEASNASLSHISGWHFSGGFRTALRLPRHSYFCTELLPSGNVQPALKDDNSVLINCEKY